MAKDPAARFGSMRELAAAIDAALRPPALESPAVETFAAPSLQSAAQPKSDHLAEFFAAISAERKESRAQTAAAVEAAVARHRTPRWAIVMVGLAVAGALGAIVFFTRSDKVKVTIELADVDLADRSLSFLLDEGPISADALANPVELKPGEHVLVVKRGREVVKRMLSTVKGGWSPGIKVRDITPPPRSDDPSSTASAEDSEWELADWLSRRGLTVAITTGDIPRTWDQFNAAARWSWRPKDLPKGPFRLIGIGLQRANQQVPPEVFRRYGEARNLVALLHFRCPTFDDSGLAAISTCRGLVHLEIRGTRITDAGLKHLSGMKYLRTLEVAETAASGSGLADAQDLYLTGLSLGGRDLPAAWTPSAGSRT
jgi:hypothetical protein